MFFVFSVLSVPLWFNFFPRSSLRLIVFSAPRGDGDKHES
jgi:hypothetical protein